MSQFRSGLHATLDQLVPDICVFCHCAFRHRPEIPLCPYCTSSLPENTPCCRFCALPLEDSHDTCGECLLAPPEPEHLTLAPCLYKDEGRFLVHQFKFNQGIREGRVLAHLVCELTADHYDAALPDLLIPVPTSWRRQFQRGFNPAGALAAFIGETLHIPIDHRVARKKHTRPQRQLSRSERLKLPVSTFSVQRPLTGRHVVLIDDVMTTGRTFDVLRRVCYRAGATRVDAWCAARAVI